MSFAHAAKRQNVLATLLPQAQPIVLTHLGKFHEAVSTLLPQTLASLSSMTEVLSVIIAAATNAATPGAKQVRTK